MVDTKKEKESFGNAQDLATRERMRAPEDASKVEAPKNGEQNLETLSWMEKIEKKFARVPNDTTDVTDDNVVIQQPQTQQPPVTLPVNQQQMQVGKKAKTDLGIAWLVEWAMRQIKLLSRLGRKVRLQDLPEIEQTNKPTN